MNDYKLQQNIDSIKRHLDMVESNHKTYVLGETPSHLYSSSYGGQERVVDAVKRHIRSTELFQDADLLDYYAGYIGHRPDSPYAIY